MKKGKKNMKYLIIENGLCKYYGVDKEYHLIDDISKDDILYLLNIATDENSDFEMDNIENKEINNPAHKIIYRNLNEKFNELLTEKTRFVEESEALYKEALNKYQ